MAIMKRFFFDGDEIREEKTGKDGGRKDVLGKPNGAGNIVRRGKNDVSGRRDAIVGKQKQTQGKDKIDMGEIQMLVSSLLTKNGNHYARVSFLRGEDIAEGIVPDGKLEYVSGFTKEEEAGLKFYLSANKEAILAQAGQIDPLTNWLRTPPKA
ncbi:MAG: hypothetical protein K2N63_11595 [Lachnospiraceae bacterium]|nr:hypothetical protein [Lachnospiraceae bacterium]